MNASTQNPHRYQPAFDSYVRVPAGTAWQRQSFEETGSWRAPPAARQGTGRVLLGADGSPRIEVDGGWRAARVAAGCLLQPQEGDLVLWFVDGDAAWVLHVLERAPADTAPQVCLPDGAVLGTRDEGALTLRAGALGVECRNLNLESEEVSVVTRAARLVTDTCLSVGRLAESAFGTLKLVGEHFHAVFDRLHSHAREHQRVSQEIDLVQAGTLDLRGSQLANVHAPNVTVEGEQLVKLRGGQIHMG